MDHPAESPALLSRFLRVATWWPGCCVTRGQAVGTRLSGRVHAAAILATIVATSPLSQRAAAQAVEPPPPTRAECRAAIAALRSHSPEPSDWVQTAGCGKAGGKVLAAALRAGASDPDTSYLHALLGALSRIRECPARRHA